MASKAAPKKPGAKKAPRNPAGRAKAVAAEEHVAVEAAPSAPEAGGLSAALPPGVQLDGQMQELLGKVSPDELEAMIDAIKAGKTALADAYGIERPTLDAMCQIGYSMYEAGHYKEAAAVLSLIVQLDNSHYEALRGLGAVLQAWKRYRDAGFIYALAVGASQAQGRVDIASKVLMGECQIMAGDREGGLETLEQVVEVGSERLTDAPYVRRAKSIVDTGGKLPPPIIFLRGDKPVGRPALSVEEGGEIDPFAPEDREITWDDIKKVPELRQGMQEVLKAIQDGKLTFGQVGGFAGEDYESLFAVASQYAQQEEYENAVLVVSFLLILDGLKPRYFLFIASVMQRMGQYETAEHMYDDMAHNMSDHVLYHLNAGETKIMVGKVDEGCELLERCLELGDDGDETTRRYHKRAERLLKMYGNRAASADGGADDEIEELQ